MVYELEVCVEGLNAARAREYELTKAGSAALTFNRSDSARYTKQLEQYLECLETEAEYETDQLLVQLIRIQHLTDRIFQFNCRDQLVEDLPGLRPSSAEEHREAFQALLDRFQTWLPAKIKRNCTKSLPT